MIYSGSAVVDWQDTAGFGERALVAAYTAHTPNEERQHVAFSTDRGRTWQHYAGNPVLAIGAKDFRDPKMFWHEPTRRWVMVVSLPHEHRVRFYGSPNLREWAHLSEFGPAGSCGGAWECPDFFPMRIELPFRGEGPDREKWILKVDDWQGIGNASGAQYFVGEFDGTTFTCDDAPDVIRPIDFGMDFYAAQSWSDAPDGRRVWLAWMSNWAYASKTPTSPWRGTMTLPREVTLRVRERDGEMYLAQEPVRELQALRRQHWHISKTSMAEAAAWLQEQAISGTALEIDVTFDATEFALAVRVGAAERTTIGFDGDALFVDRSQSGHAQLGFSSRFDDRHAVKLEGAQAQRLRVRVFVDACSVEVFCGDGRVVMSELIFPDDGSMGVALRGEGRVTSMDVWRLSS